MHATFDCDEFGGARIEEYDRLETVTELAQAIIEHGPAYTAYLDNVGQDYATPEGVVARPRLTANWVAPN